jgi:hypothetical protein
MGRFYSVAFEDVSVSAAQDLLNITATSSMALRLWRVTGGQRSITVFEARPIRIRRLPATVTAGSGGAAVTPSLLRPGDPAATFTARRNDTTAMTTSGTAVTLLTREFEFLNGFDLVLLPQEEIIVRPGEGLAINLPTAPSGATSMSWTAIVEELL